MKSVPIVSVTGWSGTGKTSLILRVIREMKNRGIRTAAFKNTHHEVYADRPGTDSYEYIRAGAAASGLGTPGGILLFREEISWSADLLRGLFPEADLILCEGLRLPDIPVVQTAGALARKEDLKGDLSECSLILTDNPGLSLLLAEEGIALLPQEDIRPFCSYLADLLSAP